MKRYTGKVALVTGGGTGIGRAIARRLAEEGALVVVAGRRPTPLDETVGLIRGAGGDAEAVRGDLTQEADARRAVEEAIRLYGSLSVLVNNAGSIRRDLPAGATSPAEWRQLIDSNLTSAYLVSRAALPKLSRSDAAIVNVASTLALVSVPGTAAYQAAKAGLLGLTRSMAVDYAPKVRVNAVLPGLVHTPLSYVDRPEFDELLPSLEKSHPMGRVGRPEDVAGAVAYVASADAAWVTGTTLVVDGGFSIT